MKGSYLLQAMIMIPNPAMLDTLSSYFGPWGQSRKLPLAPISERLCPAAPHFQEISAIPAEQANPSH